MSVGPVAPEQQQPMPPAQQPPDLRVEAGGAILQAVAALAQSAQGAPIASDAREYATAVQALAQGFASLSPKPAPSPATPPTQGAP